MSKNTMLYEMKKNGRARAAVPELRKYVRDHLRSAIGAADPQVFYFSLNGMVMPLSSKTL